MPINRIPEAPRENIALLVGNGINRFGKFSSMNSWSELLAGLAKERLGTHAEAVPSGLSYTEFFDLLELRGSTRSSSADLQASFCEPMKGWQPDEHHSRIVEWAHRHEAPILTTNFDDLLSRAIHTKMLSASAQGFTDFYPWDRYFAKEELKTPTSGFGIWHVNGMIRYKRSIRLGLTHYMGSVGRARDWLHNGNEMRLFSGKDIEHWKGASTWLDIVFNRPLLVFGLALEENEVFLRWLLIERAKYFKVFPDRKKDGWFAYVGQESEGKLFFLRGVGLKPVQVASYADLYSEAAWNDASQETSDN